MITIEQYHHLQHLMTISIGLQVITLMVGVPAMVAIILSVYITRRREIRTDEDNVVKAALKIKEYD